MRWLWRVMNWRKRARARLAYRMRGWWNNFGMGDRTAKARVFRESGMKSLHEEGVVAARPVQDRNLVTMRKAKSPKLAMRLKALKGLRRGRLQSQSLDSIESSVIYVDLEIFRNQGAKTTAASRLSTVASLEEHATEEAAISIDAKRAELESLPVSSRLELPRCTEQKLEIKENGCTGFLDNSTTTELAAAEILPPQEVSLVEDPTPNTESAECSPGEPAGNLYKVPETEERRRCQERGPNAQDQSHHPL